MADATADIRTVSWGDPLAPTCLHQSLLRSPCSKGPFLTSIKFCVVKRVGCTYNWLVFEDYFTNEDWQLADKAAAFLQVDRDVCRRAFHREPAHRVREVVQWVLSERDLPDHDPESMIEGWARDHGAGVFSDQRRGGDLERVDGIAMGLMSTIVGRDAVA